MNAYATPMNAHPNMISPKLFLSRLSSLEGPIKSKAIVTARKDPKKNSRLGSFLIIKEMTTVAPI